ncbi:hypothetical protein VPH35_079246 [Triticum aestivum]|uniref:uncharacterized protein n=1 Tax=Triticum aestivum TaxID=4565 RepID=UPI000844B07B|nr:uncharacterized protein LOC123100219 [Triticum aestivum]
MNPSGPPHPAPSDAGGRGEDSSSSSAPPPPQQQGYATQPVPTSPQQQGYAIQHVWLPQPSAAWALGAGAPPFAIGPPVPGAIPPLRPQFWPQQHPYWWSGGNHLPLGPTVWGPTSNASQYMDAMVAQQRPAAPTWPQQPQFVQYPPLQPPPPTHQDWRLVHILSELLRSPRTLDQMVLSLDAEHSAILLHQLEVGDEQMRDMVLDGFKQCAHWIMGNRPGHAVFQALLRSIQVIVDDDRRYEELQIIVEAAATPELAWRSDDGVASLMLLITAVAWSPGLSTALVNYFVRDRVMDNVGGDELITRCFTTMGDEVTRALVRHAMDTIDDKLDSSFGVPCLGTCFWYAAGDELPLFQDALVERAVTMAMGRNSNRLVQRLIDRGENRIDFRRRLLSRLMQHLVRLSNNWYGRFVLQRCFKNAVVALQPIVLTACADLPQGDVQALVMHEELRPLHRVLQGGNTNYPAEARRLALKIQALPLHIREQEELQPLMRAVTRVLADNLANLGD